MLRDYQQRAIDQCYAWMRDNDGNPCIVIPTGGGKSHIIAALCKDALQTWPETRILMLTHVRELIAQNAEKMRLHWPNAPMGIYSAGLGKRNLGEPITFAGIQSVRTKADRMGHVDLIIIDECHLVGHKDEGGYRALIGALTAINPALRVIGFTATPYRLGHGMITDKPAIFDALIEPVSVLELIEAGHLSVLRSKHTGLELATDGVHKRGGEFIESELQAAVNTAANNAAIIAETIERGKDRNAWLFFCAGVSHAQDVAAMLSAEGIATACVTGDTPKAERDRILADYKAGKIRALTNANVLTTGFDYPGIDLIAMLRPTLSPGLYVQMAGRGLRVADGKDDCMVLDFAGNVSSHGPITNVVPPNRKRSEEPGEAPSKTCELCGEIVHASVRTCPACFAPFPEPEKKPLKLHDDDIMGFAPKDMSVKEWAWNIHTSRTSGNEMLRVSYYGGLSDPVVHEYLPVLNGGYAEEKAMAVLASCAGNAGVVLGPHRPEESRHEWLERVADAMHGAKPPAFISYRADGKFYRVQARTWQEMPSPSQ